MIRQRSLRSILLLFFLSVSVISLPQQAIAADGVQTEKEGSVLNPSYVLERGYSGIGYLVLASIFGQNVIDHIVDFDEADLAKANAEISFTGPDNGVTLSMMAFSAKLAFAAFPLFIFTLSATGLINGLQDGELFESDGSSFLAFRWVTGIAAAFPMPHLYGLAMIQQVVVTLALFSNGLGNIAADDLVRGSFLGAAGADVIAGNILPLPPNPDLQAEVEIIKANMMARKSCTYHARSMGMSVDEIRTICQSAAGVGAGSSWTGGSGSNCRADLADISEFALSLCQTTELALKELDNEMDAALQIPDRGDRVLAMAAAASNFDLKIKMFRTEFDIVLSEQVGAKGSSLDPMAHMQELVDKTGWPGLGLAYMRIAKQVEGMKTSITTGAGDAAQTFDYSMLPEMSRVGQDIRMRMDSTGAELEAAEVIAAYQGAGTDIIKKPKGSFEYIGDSIMRFGGWLSDGTESGAGWLANAQGMLIADFVNSGSGIEVVYDASTTVMGALAAGVMAHDAALIGGKFLPTGRLSKAFSSAKGGAGNALASGAKKMGTSSDTIKSGVGKTGSFFSNIMEQIKTKFSGGNGPSFQAGNSLIAHLVTFFLGTLLFLLLAVSFINVAVIPKLPALFVGIMVLDWAITLMIIAFGAPLWMVLNLSVQHSGRALATAQVLRGLQSLLWVMLFPVLIVFSIAISMVVLNIAIPLLGTLIGSSVQDGIMADLISLVSMPIILLFMMTLICLLSMSLIVRIPEQFAGFLGITPMRGQMIDQAMSFVGGQNNMQILQEQTSIKMMK